MEDTATWIFSMWIFICYLHHYYVWVNAGANSEATFLEANIVNGNISDIFPFFFEEMDYYLEYLQSESSSEIPLVSEWYWKFTVLFSLLIFLL